MTLTSHCHEQTKAYFLYQISTILIIVTINVQYQNQMVEKVMGAVADDEDASKNASPTFAML